MLFLQIFLMYLYILAQVAFDILMLQLLLFLFQKKKKGVSKQPNLTNGVYFQVNYCFFHGVVFQFSPYNLFFTRLGHVMRCHSELGFLRAVH